MKKDMPSLRSLILPLTALFAPCLVLSQDLNITSIDPFTPEAVLNEFVTIDPSIVTNVQGSITGQPSQFGKFEAAPGLIGITEVVHVK